MVTPSGIFRYPKGTILAREGETTGDGMYIILKGEADAYRNYESPGQVFEETIGQGGYYGEASLFLNKWSNVTVVARSDVAVMAVSRKNALTSFARQPEIAFAIMEDLYRKLDAALSAPAGAEAAAPTANQDPPRQRSGQSPLFPADHGSYMLPLSSSDSEYLYEQNIACPLCGETFKSPTVISSRLRREAVDKDLRARYKDFEPLYYDVVTCPHCFYSANSESFSNISKLFAQRIGEAVAPYSKGLSIKTGAQRDTFAVFAGYYLALACAPVYLDDYQLTRAGLWQKLGRLYSDLIDTVMCEYAYKNALDDYLYAYQHFNVSDKQMQQICYIIGDYYQKLGDLDNARNYFYMAKTNRGGNSMMVRQADLRLDEIRDIIKSAK